MLILTSWALLWPPGAFWGPLGPPRAGSGAGGVGAGGGAVGARVGGAKAGAGGAGTGGAGGVDDILCAL